MTTNFFQNIATLNLPGTWKLIIQTDEQGNFTVSELFKATCGDKAVNLIVPLNLTGTAKDLDEGFFSLVTTPAVKSTELMSNLEAHLKSVEQAKAASKMEQDKKAKTAKPVVADAKKDGDSEASEAKLEKKKLYEATMKAIADLSADCKYEQALTLLPSVEEYPDRELEINKLKTDLLRKKEQYNQVKLF
jgi:PRTRC genetic system protein E